MNICCTYAKLNISECLVAFNGIAPNRIGQMMKRLMRAAVMDSWDWNDGNEDLTSGDKIFIPKNEFEKNLWISLRSQQKEDFKKLVATRKGGEATKKKFEDAKQRVENMQKQIQKPEITQKPAPQAQEQTPVDKQERIAKVQAIIGNLSRQFDEKQNAMIVYPDTDMSKLRGAFGDFMRIAFTPNTLKTLTDWCIKNYLGRGIKTETILKVASRIGKKDYNEVWYRYINTCC